MAGINVPDSNAHHYAQRMRRMDKDYGWPQTDQIMRTTQFLAVVDHLDYWRVLEFAELWYLINGKKCPDVDDVRAIMNSRPTLFQFGVGSASELYHYGETAHGGSGGVDTLHTARISEHHGK